jgi:hypothetical protein
LGTLNAIYVRATDPDTARRLLTEHPNAFTEPGSPFYAVELPPSAYRTPEAALADLSDRLSTDVLWLSFQSLVDAFQFHHWRDGAHLRALVFGCYGRNERTWERVEGSSEPWERDAFFGDPVKLDIFSEFADKAARAELERIWRDSALAPGQTFPCLDARESARGVAEFYRLPGWGLDDGENDDL